MSDQAASRFTPVSGPVQLLVVEFDGDQLDGSILAELRRLSERDIVRLVDLLFVTKGEDGELEAVEARAPGVEEIGELGAAARALIGLGAGGEEVATGSSFGTEVEGDGRTLGEEQVWYVADAIPNGSSAAIVLLEHRWAIALRDAAEAARGEVVADAWIHPLDLVAVGLASSDDRP